jgi:hypothetical protein
VIWSLSPYSLIGHHLNINLIELRVWVENPCIMYDLCGVLV